MKNASTCVKQLGAILKQLGAVEPPEMPEADDPIAVFVMSFLMWETSTEKALTGFRNIRSGVVDFNELRVCMPQEIVDLIGPRYPRALDRCQRLRAGLRDIYANEHAVNLDRLASLSKREVRKYLESLEGMVPYVAARVTLLAFDGHAIPVDDQLRTLLIEAGAADTSAENAELASWLEHHIKADDSRQAHAALQAWVDSGGKMKQRRPRKAAATKQSSRTTARKKSTRKMSRT